MKFFKRTLAIVALLATCPMFAARPTTAAKAPAKNTAPVARGKAAVKPAAVTAQTYPQIVAFIKNSNGATVWNDSEKKLNAQFCDKIAEMALTAGLADYQLDSLLQTARDYHAKFTGTAEDTNILNKLAAERKATVEWFNKGKSL